MPRTKKLLTARFEVQILGEEPERVKDCPTMGSLFVIFALLFESDFCPLVFDRDDP